MKIGINMNAYPTSIEEQVRLMRGNGFDATFSMADSETLEEEIAACRRAGIVHENLHAPFRGINAIWEEGEAGEEMLSRLLLAVDNASRYEIPIIVIHMSSGPTPPRVNLLGLSRFDRLFAHAKGKGITLAIENQRKLGNISVAFEEYPDAAFCFDTGHQFCFSPGIPFLQIFGQKTVALHIHDNNKAKDEHRLPFDADIDFNALMMELADTPYHGAVMLEVIATHTPYYADVSAEEYYARAAKGAIRLRDMLRYHRTDV